jgi:hypothetical protein
MDRSEGLQAPEIALFFEAEISRLGVGSNPVNRVAERFTGRVRTA